MKLHPRTQLVNLAACDIQKAVLDIAMRDSLTFIELTGILTGCIQQASKYALRAERHPDDPDSPAGLE